MPHWVTQVWEGKSDHIATEMSPSVKSDFRIHLILLKFDFPKSLRVDAKLL